MFRSMNIFLSKRVLTLFLASFSFILQNKIIDNVPITLYVIYPHIFYLKKKLYHEITKGIEYKEKKRIIHPKYVQLRLGQVP